MAKKKIEKVVLDTKVAKVELEVKNEPILEVAKETFGLDLEKTYRFLSNGKSPYIKEGQEVYVSGSMAIMFIERGYGKVLND
jgi:hypothetical protein